MEGIGVDGVLVEAHKLYARCQQQRPYVEVFSTLIDIEAPDQMRSCLLLVHWLRGAIRQDEQVILRSVTCRRQVHLSFGELQENFQITDPLVTSLWKDTLDFRWKMPFRCFPGIRNGTC